jgi:hypothetical protein
MKIYQETFTIYKSSTEVLKIAISKVIVKFENYRENSKYETYNYQNK